MASLKHHLEGSLKNTLGGISHIFPLYFMVLLKQLQKLYIGGFIFQVLLITALVQTEPLRNSRQILQNYYGP